jgi:hypothetical protein
MNKDLIFLLRSRYPPIFTHEASSPSCGDGWFTLIDALCECLQFSTVHQQLPQAVATQVKEKLGRLRIYAGPGLSPEQRGMISMASTMSARIWEVCGDPAVQAEPPPLSSRCARHDGSPVDSLA